MPISWMAANLIGVNLLPGRVVMRTVQYERISQRVENLVPPKFASGPWLDGYGSGLASCVTKTGQSDFAKTASVVDVHWRGGPMTRTSTSDVSVTLTISVAGTPCLTTTSVSHHEFASGGIAANNWS
jgi:hypothetical protein